MRTSENNHQSFYYTNKKVKEKIDKLLEENARIWANLGTDTEYDLKTRERGEKRWKQISKEIKILDESYHGLLCPYGIDS